MCDYSLHHVATRPAKIGDKIVSTAFNRSASRGFAAIGEPNVAVCLVPGTELAFEADVLTVPALPFLRNRRIGHKVARFRQINLERPDLHHDALEFPDGRIVLVTKLCEGQRAAVLQLPAAARPPARQTSDGKPLRAGEIISG
jgi:hypothetical protein